MHLKLWRMDEKNWKTEKQIQCSKRHSTLFDNRFITVSSITLMAFFTDLPKRLRSPLGKDNITNGCYWRSRFVYKRISDPYLISYLKTISYDLNMWEGIWKVIDRNLGEISITSLAVIADYFIVFISHATPKVQAAQLLKIKSWD